MVGRSCLTVAAHLVGVLAPVAHVPVAHGQGVGPDREPVVTSDGVEYCNALRGRIIELMHRASQPREAAALSMEGERMCEHGRTRGGILRLRRAIVLLSHGGG